MCLSLGCRSPNEVLLCYSVTNATTHFRSSIEPFDDQCTISILERNILILGFVELSSHVSTRLCLKVQAIGG